MSIKAIQAGSPSFKAVLTPVAQSFIANEFNNVLENGTRNEIREAAKYYSQIHTAGTNKGWKLNAARTSCRYVDSGETVNEDLYILSRPDKYDRVILKTTSKESMSPLEKLKTLAEDLTQRAKRKPRMSEEESQREVENLSAYLKEHNIKGISFTLDTDA